MDLTRFLPRAASLTPSRAVLFGAALVVGALAGSAWNPDLTNWAYYAFLQTFFDPRTQVAHLGIGVAAGFLTGFIHVVSI